MSLQADSQSFADEEYKGVHLRAVLGGYEFVFMSSGKVSQQEGPPLWLHLHSGRISVRTSIGQQDLGTAFPAIPIHIRQLANRTHFSIELKLPLSAYQLTKLEDYRGAGNLDFTITLAGIGGRGDRTNPEHQAVQVHVAQSTWIEQLKQEKAREILLLEIAVPSIDAAAPRKAMIAYLREAHSLYGNGHYSQCVTSCRKAVEEIREDLPDFAWGLLESKASREDMKKGDRLNAVVATAHLFAHPSAHSESWGGMQYSRADAKFMLAMVSAYIDHFTSD